jgi:predicted nucleic acid-binding protein
MARYMLDTNICIYLMKRHSLRAWHGALLNAAWARW